MKFFALFMTGVMLITGFSLCSGEDSCNEEAEVNLSSSHESKQDSERMCSPFCNCSRCPFSIVVPAKVSDKPLVVQSDKRFIHQSVFLLQRIITPILQPPKSV